MAEAAGVSKTTVSFILNGRDDLRISEQTKKKVWHVIKMLNYRPNLYAKNLRSTQMNKVIAFFMGKGLTELERLSFLAFFDAALPAGYTYVLLPERRSSAAADHGYVPGGTVR